MSIAWIQLLLAAVTVGFGLVWCTRLPVTLVAGLGLPAGAGYGWYIAFFTDPGPLGRELELAIGAIFLGTMLVAWLVGVGSAALLRRRAVAQS